MIGNINKRDAVKSFEATLDIIDPTPIVAGRLVFERHVNYSVPVRRQKFETMVGEIEWWRILGFCRRG